MNNNYYTVLQEGFHVESRENGTKKMLGFYEIGEKIYYPTNQTTPVYAVYETESAAIEATNEHSEWLHDDLPYRIKMPVILSLKNLNVDPTTGINSGGYYEKIAAFKENGRPFYPMYDGAWVCVYAADVLPEDLTVLTLDSRVIYEYFDQSN